MQINKHSEAGDCLLETRALRFSFGPQPLIHTLNLRIAAGLSAITGDESSGKTTLLRLLAGELTPQAGTVLLQGTPMSGVTGAWPGAIHWVDPRTEAWDSTTVRSYLLQAQARYPGWDVALQAELLGALNLTVHLDKTLSMLSTGSRRKVFLAAGFASGARVTLLDMPFAALDGASVRVVHSLLEEAAVHPQRAWVVADYAPPADLPLATHCHLGGP